MGNNGGMKKSTIIAIAVIAVIVIIILCCTVFKKESKVEYNLTKSLVSSENTFFKDYKSFKKFADSKKIEDTMTNKVTFKKSSFAETYTEEFFNDKKLAVVVVYEDTSKDYMYSIDKLEYNDDKTEVTIKYTYKYGTFADVLSSTWYNYMFVELPSSVEHVNFQKDNGTNEK